MWRDGEGGHGGRGGGERVGVVFCGVLKFEVRLKVASRSR